MNKFKNKKVFFITGAIILVLLVSCCIVTVLILKNQNIINFKGTYWLDEGDKGFEESTEIKRILEETIPNREYSLRYYKKHTNPDLVNSLYVAYVDPDFDLNNLEKYLNVEAQDYNGEFVTLGDALCLADVREELSYNIITFHVSSSAAEVSLYYENDYFCFN